eukprot:8405223-Alexandrium_andersonii.AAC.1
MKKEGNPAAYNQVETKFAAWTEWYNVRFDIAKGIATKLRGKKKRKDDGNAAEGGKGSEPRAKAAKQ